MDLIDYKILKNSDSNFWYEARKKLIFKMLKSVFSDYSPERLILDIGCGTGINFEELKKFGRVFGLEKNPEAINISRQKKYLIIEGSIEKINLDIEKYDAICCFDVLEHIENDSLALEKIFASLKAGGYLFFSLPAYLILFGPHDLSMKHFRRYNKKELRQKLAGKNYQNINLYYWNSILFPLVFLIRITKKYLFFFYRNQEVKTEIRVNNKIINKILFFVLAMEVKLFFKKSWLPFGLSIYGFAKKHE